MSLTRGVLLVVGIVVATGIVAASVGVLVHGSKAPAVRQPIRFSHSAHVKKEEIECTECHGGARTEAHAGFPDIRECADCHRDPQGHDPDEPKVREYAKKGIQIPWVQVNRNVGHVYFSHRAHVTFAKMKCVECHGRMEDLDRPPRHPKPALHSMDACIECHEARHATLECANCHR